MQGAFIFHEPVSMIRMAHEATYDSALATPRQASPSLAMAPHLSLAELNLIAKSSGEQKAPKDIHALISAKRRARKVDPPKIWAVRFDDFYGAVRNLKP